MDPQLESFFDVLCAAASSRTMPLFRTNSEIDNKLGDGFDPVTEADRGAEKAIRAIITARYPDHGIVGEEFGTENEGAEYQWIIDPIDGTRAFVSGLPSWGTLIGLYRNGKPFAGCMDQPFTGERFVAVPQADGSLASVFKHRADAAQEMQTRYCPDLSSATIMTTDPGLFQDQERDKFGALRRACRLHRYGTDCYAYCMVALGQADLVVESGLNIYDIAALIPIIEGAGGVVTNWEGGDASKGGQVLASANQRLHDQALALLSNS